MKKLSAAGFTMLELLIVVAIMATLTALSSQSIQQAIKNKIKLQGQIDDVSEVRDSLKVMERDINLAFHYNDLELEMKNAVKQKRANPGGSTPTTIPNGGAIPTTTLPNSVYNPNDPSDPLNKPTPNRKDPRTQFIGSDTEMSFATMNTARVSETDQQADFIKVGYTVKTCHKPGSSGLSSKCLVRRASPVVEGDYTKGGDDTVLLEDVSEFSLRYFGFGKQDWVTSWDSLNGDSSVQNKYPDAVEISLKVEKETNGKKKKVSMQIVAPIRFPNNEKNPANQTQPQAVPSAATPNNNTQDNSGTGI